MSQKQNLAMGRIEKMKQAQQQLAAIWQCDAQCFADQDHHFIPSEDVFFEVISFGKNAVIRAHPQIIDWCKEQLQTLEPKELLDGESLFELESLLRTHGFKLGGEHVRYLYDRSLSRSTEAPASCSYKLFTKEALKELDAYRQFDNALNFHSDVIAYAAYSGEEVVALAGADDYLGSLWQIGIDTSKTFRQGGLGSYLVSTLAREIEEAGATPFYTTWSANLASTRLAIKAGFFPAWITYFAEPLEKKKVSN